MLDDFRSDLVFMKGLVSSVVSSFRSLGYVLERVVRRRSLKAARTYLEQNVYSFEQTMERITVDGASISRFGDGEFYLMLRPETDLGFQLNSPELRAELREVLVSPNPSLLVCIPPMIQEGYFWRHFWAREWRRMQLLLRMPGPYGCAQITRPQYFTSLGESGVDAWRRVWAEKRVIVVTGEGSRFQLLPELFDAAKDVRIILGPAENAYEEINRIEDQVAAIDHDLTLLALGPAGTVLASRLVKTGRQVLDIGHLPNSFRTVFQNFPDPERQSPDVNG